MLFALLEHCRHVECICFGSKKVEIDVGIVLVDFGRGYLAWRWRWQ
jgi:hypothetical protein